MLCVFKCLLFRFEARDIDGGDDRSREKHMRDDLVTILGMDPALNRLVKLVSACLLKRKK